jgi:pilus assembly protein Flp/PilA
VAITSRDGQCAGRTSRFRRNWQFAFAPRSAVPLQRLISKVRRLIVGERGATMAEYAILVAVIAIVVIIGAKSLGTSVNTRFDNTAGSINNG